MPGYWTSICCLYHNCCFLILDFFFLQPDMKHFYSPWCLLTYGLLEVVKFNNPICERRCISMSPGISSRKTEHIFQMFYSYIYICIFACMYIHGQPHRSIQTENTNQCPINIHLNTQHSQNYEQHWWAHPLPPLQLTRTDAATGTCVHITQVPPGTSLRQPMQ